METNLLDRMLNTYQDAQTPVTMTLQNKIRVSGKIKAFDSYVIVMENHKREIVYRHAISSLAPYARDERKYQPAVRGYAPAKTAPPGPARVASQKPSHKPRPAQPRTLSPSVDEPNLNNSMKDGLLKWMREQKAAT